MIRLSTSDIHVLFYVLVGSGCCNGRSFRFLTFGRGGVFIETEVIIRRRRLSLDFRLTKENQISRLLFLHM